MQVEGGWLAGGGEGNEVPPSPRHLFWDAPGTAAMSAGSLCLLGGPRTYGLPSSSPSVPHAIYRGNCRILHSPAHTNAFIVTPVLQVWRQYTSLQKGLITAIMIIAVFFFSSLSQPADSLDTDVLASPADPRLASKDDLPDLDTAINKLQSENERLRTALANARSRKEQRQRAPRPGRQRGERPNLAGHHPQKFIQEDPIEDPVEDPVEVAVNEPEPEPAPKSHVPEHQKIAIDAVQPVRSSGNCAGDRTGDVLRGGLWHWSIPHPSQSRRLFTPHGLPLAFRALQCRARTTPT